MKLHFGMILALVMVVLGSAGQADQVRWNSSWVDTYWDTSGNWNTGTVPGSADLAFIEKAVSVSLNGSSPDVDQLFVGGSGASNSQITVATGETISTNYLKISEYDNYKGDVLVEGGNIVVNNAIRMSRADHVETLGYLGIASGSVEAGSLVLDENGDTTGLGSLIDIEEGYLAVSGNVVDAMIGYVENGQLTGYQGGENVRIKYDSGEVKTYAYGDPNDIALGSVLVRYHYAFEDGDWFNPKNWDVPTYGGGYRVPRVVDFAFVDRNVEPYIENGTAKAYDMFMGENLGGQSYEVKLTVGSGGVLEITRILAIAEYANSNGTLIVDDGGYVNVVGTLRMSRNDSANCFAKIIVNDGGSFRTRNATYDQNGTVYGNNCTIELDGSGTFTASFNRVSVYEGLIAAGKIYGNGVQGAAIAEYDSEDNVTVVRALSEEEMNQQIWVTWKETWEDDDWFNLNNWLLHSGSTGLMIRPLTLEDYAFIDRNVEVKIAGEALAKRVFMGERGPVTLTVEQGGSLHVADAFFVARYDVSDAILKVDDGSVLVDGTLYVSENDISTCTGHVELIDGVIDCYRLNLDAKGTTSPGASFNIKDGILKTNYSYLSEVEGYIADGYLTGYGQSDTLTTQILDGKVWVWATDPNYAYNPDPADNTKWLDPCSITLSWSAGGSTLSHNVYFGGEEILADINGDGVIDSDDLVFIFSDWLGFDKSDFSLKADLDRNGSVDLADFAIVAANMGSDLSGSFKGNQGGTSYVCGPLNYGQRYYWRIDEVKAGGTLAGDVWRFSTANDSQTVGTPIIWTAATPDYTQANAGLPVLNASHAQIHYGSPVESGGDGLVNHFSFICEYNGYLVASWQSHKDTFDAAGSRVLYSASSDGVIWTAAVPVIDSLSAVGDNTVDGYICYNQWFREVDGTLYEIVKVRRKLSGSWKGEFYIARKFDATAVVDGAPFWLETETPADSLGDYANLTDLQMSNPTLYADAAALRDYIDAYHDYYGHFASYGSRGYTSGIDGNLLFEPSFFTRPDGREVMVARAAGSYQRLFAVDRVAGGLWTGAAETNIQDSPALSRSGNLPDGTCYLLGNHVAYLDGSGDRNPLTIVLSSDGVYFDRAYAVRATPYARNYEISSKIGCQYPDAVVADGYLWVVYSIHAQDIGVSKIALTELD